MASAHLPADTPRSRNNVGVAFFCTMSPELERGVRANDGTTLALVSANTLIGLFPIHPPKQVLMQQRMDTVLSLQNLTAEDH